mgnify:CR=1 FL=1
MEKKRKVPAPVTKGCAKVPVVMQMEALECGAASLTMILAYYGKFLPLEQVRTDCGVSRDGSSAKNILIAARSYGMLAKAYLYEVDDLKKVGKFPCIIHWNMNHFVVLDGFRKGKAVLNDPAKGCIRVSMEEFDNSFTGVCMVITPTEEFVPGGKPQSVMKFALSRLRGTGVGFALILTTSFISILLSLLNPAFSRVFIDRLLAGKNPEWLYPFTLALGALAVIQLLTLAIKGLYMLKVEGKLAIISNSAFMWHVLRAPMEFFSQRMAGDIADRQTKNESVAQELMNTFAPLLLDAIMMVVYFVVMLRYSLILTVVGVFSIVLNLLVARLTAAKKVNITRVQMRNAGKLAGMTVNGIGMIESIKASGAENGYYEKWAGYQASVNTQNVRYAKINQYLGVLPGFISSLANIAVLILGVFLTMRGEFTVGMILAFQGYMASFAAPAGKLIAAGQKLQETRTNMERIEDVLRYPADVEYTENDVSDKASYDKLSGTVELRDVTFGYARLGKPLIEHFSMTLRPGSRVAFVGSSGCGKSTLSKLISGLYKPWSGEILFDGKPIGEINREVFTGSLAVVDQDIILFEDTIANNIKMWDPSIEDFEMIMAARDAQIHEDIMQRDGGYQYKIMEGGKDFSGGQRQRMEIARVLAQDPTIIIMDEATSALDAKTEYEVVKSIKDRGITCIVVAHRLSTIRDCDEIIVMDRGRVVERGTHDELFALGGLYTRLITSE